MKVLLTTLFFLPGLALFCQPHYYDLPKEVPQQYAYNAEAELTRITNETQSKFSAKELKEYAEALAYSHEEMLESGRIYFNWTEAENYLVSLVNKITTLVNTDKKFRVFLVRDDDMNASAQDNGIIYINIGLLAEIRDEAALVSVLAHEISHALNSDTKTIYAAHNNFRRKNGKTKDLVSLCHDNQKLESRADEESFSTATRLGYDISSCYHNFIKFESDFRWYKSQYSYQDPKWFIALDNLDKDKDIRPDSLEKYLSGHPENFLRISMLLRYVGKENGKKKFSDNEEFFYRLRSQARIEQLYIAFSEASYRDCLRNALYYHLQEQQNADYLWYINESILKLIVANPSIRRKGFLTDESKEKIFEKNKGILHDVSFVSLDSTFTRLVKNDPVYGHFKKPFETYSQAYNFFMKKSGELKVPGRDFTAALFELNYARDEKAKELLDSLTPATGTGYAEVRNAVLSGTFRNAVEGNRKTVVYIQAPEFYSGTGNNLKYSFSESRENAQKLVKQIMNGWMPGGNNLFLYSDSINITEYDLCERLSNEFREFKNEKQAMADNTQSFAIDEAYWRNRENMDPLDPEVLERKKDFFVFSPGFWKYFKEKDWKSFTVIQPYLYRHPVMGTYVYFDIAGFDPVQKKYVYFNQEYLERYSESNIRKIFKKFLAQVSAGKN